MKGINKMNKIAIIGFTNPFVNNSDGGKIDTLMRIKSLNLYTDDIDVYTLLKKGEVENLNKNVDINNLYTDKVINKITNLIKLDPISVINRYNNNLIQKISDNKKKYDIAIYENYNMYKYVNHINAKINCMRVHNIESLSRKELFYATLPKPKAFAEYLESIKYKRVEKICLDKFDYFLFISKDEMEYMIKKFPKYKYKFIWVPPVTDIDPIEENISMDNKQILYYGDMTVSHNIRGLKWYIDYVWPKVINEENCRLKVIGKINDEDRQYLQKYKNIDVLGYVDDLDEYISKSNLIIAPIFTGAGVKIKVINTLSKGKVLLTTTKGIEGTSFENNVHLITADDKEEMLIKTLDIIRNPEKFSHIKYKCIDELKLNYSIKGQADKIMSLINQN